MSAAGTLARLLARESFIELGARARAAAVLDAGTFRELVGPFDRVHSPWLEMQGIVPQEDDGVVVARGLIDGRAAVAVAIESAMLAPKGQLRMYPWKDTPAKIPLAVRHVRSFLLSHRTA